MKAAMGLQTQLRTYTIREGMLDEWVEYWRAVVVPGCRERGVWVGSAWVDRVNGQFIWVVRLEGEYEPGGGGFVGERHTRVVEEEDERFRTAPSVRHSARALLLDGDGLVLFRREVRGRPTYWITPGGGVEPGDVDLEGTLRRELREELGAEVGPVVRVYTLQTEDTRMTRVSHFFVCRLVKMDLAAQSGPEFGDPERGLHEVERVPLTAAGVASIRLKPPGLAEYLNENLDTILRLI
jgi:ADP-ribose pyrophosphatase YjhB (NUDIX family)